MVATSGPPYSVRPDHLAGELLSPELPLAEEPCHAALPIHQLRSDNRPKQSIHAILIELRSLYDSLLQQNEASNAQKAILTQEAESLRRDNQSLIQSLVDTQCSFHDLQSAQAVEQRRVESLTTQRDQFEEKLVSLHFDKQTWAQNVNELVEAKNTVADELTRILHKNDELLRQVQQLKLTREIERRGRQQQEHRVLELEKTLQDQSQAEHSYWGTTQFVEEKRVGRSEVPLPVTLYEQETNPYGGYSKVDRGANTGAGSIAIGRQPRKQTLNKERVQIHEKRRAKHSSKPSSQHRKKPTQHTYEETRREAVVRKVQRQNNYVPDRFDSSAVNQAEVEAADDADTIVVYVGP